MTKRSVLFTAAWAVGSVLSVACSSAPSAPGDDAGSLDSGGSADSGSPSSSSASRADAAAVDASGSGGGGTDARADASATDASSEDAASEDAAGRDASASLDADGGTSPLEAPCASACAAQKSLSCSTDTSDCTNTCVAQAVLTENPSVSCATQFTALAKCEATLTASEWTCSETTGNPIPVAGKCKTTVCAWACCVGSDITDPDIWTECMPTCG